MATAAKRSSQAPVRTGMGCSRNLLAVFVRERSAWHEARSRAAENALEDIRIARTAARAAARTGVAAAFVAALPRLAACSQCGSSASVGVFRKPASCGRCAVELCDACVVTCALALSASASGAAPPALAASAPPALAASAPPVDPALGEWEWVPEPLVDVALCAGCAAEIRLASAATAFAVAREQAHARAARELAMAALLADVRARLERRLGSFVAAVAGVTDAPLLVNADGSLDSPLCARALAFSADANASAGALEHAVTAGLELLHATLAEARALQPLGGRESAAVLANMTAAYAAFGTRATSQFRRALRGFSAVAEATGTSLYVLLSRLVIEASAQCVPFAQHVGSAAVAALRELYLELRPIVQRLGDSWREHVAAMDRFVAEWPGQLLEPGTDAADEGAAAAVDGWAAQVVALAASGGDESEPAASERRVADSGVDAELDALLASMRIDAAQLCADRARDRLVLARSRAIVGSALGQLRAKVGDDRLGRTRVALVALIECLDEVVAAMRQSDEVDDGGFALV